MSALYNLEPQPTAKVLLQTTSGDILLELFAKQTPLTSRNFLQLCLDNYYDGTIFHRLVPGFIIQGGDPTGTGEGGEAIYDGGLFADEFHSRLKFNRRGLLGMANTGKKDDNGSQFFLTLGKTEELTKRNSMFGRVVGDTIYNLMKMGEAELVDGSERPLYPTRITGTEILVNPFEDMKRRETKAKPVVETKKEVKKKLRKQSGKALLSFGGDEDGDMSPLPVAKKAKFNTNLVTATETSNGTAPPATDSTPKPKPKKAHKPLNRHPSASASPSPSPPHHRDPNTQLPLPNPELPSRSPSPVPTSPFKTMNTLLSTTNAQIAQLKASMKRTLPPAAAEPKRQKTALEQMIPANSTRGRKRRHGGDTGGQHAQSDREALEMLNAFKAKLERVPVEGKTGTPATVVSGVGDGDGDSGAGRTTTTTTNGPKGEEDDEEAHLCDLHFIANCQSCQAWDTQTATASKENDDDDDKGWMSHALSFEKDRLGKDLTWRRKNEEELVVIDPREKGKGILQEARGRRRARA